MVAKIGLRPDGCAVDGDEAIAGPPAGRGGRRARPHGRDDRRRRVGVARLEAHPEQAAVQIVVALPAVEHGLNMAQGHGEADAGIVELGAGDGAGRLDVGLRRQGDEHAQHATANVDERAAVVGGRHVGVGLQRSTVHAAQRADHSDRHVHVVGAVGAADGDGPVAGTHLGQRGRLGNRQRRIRLDLQQDEHAIGVAADEPRGPLLAAGKPDENRRGLLRETERARYDVTVGGNDEPGGRPVGQLLLVEPVEPADCADLHDRVGHAADGGVKGLLLQHGEVLGARHVGGGAGEDDGEQRRD